jgi:hypothetical protein
VSINSSSPTSISATFQIASNATAGNHAVTVTTNSVTSNSVNFFVQVPSALSLVSTSSSAAINFTDANQQPAAGWLRTVTWQVVDQQGQPISATMNVADTIAVQTPNSCMVAGTITGNATTNSSGRFNDAYSLCTTVCLNSGSCQVSAAQTWTIHGVQNAATVAVTYSCSGITLIP